MRKGRVTIAAAALMLAGAMPGQEREDKPWFSLQTTGSIKPGGEARVEVHSTNIRTLEFRLYKVNDIEKFFLSLPDPHRFGGAWRKSASARTPLEKFANWKRRWRSRLRDLARAQYTPEQRAEIRMKQAAREPPGQREQYVPGTPLNPQQLVRSWDVPIRSKERWAGVAVPVRIDNKGLYVIEATDGELTATTIISVTDLALAVKGAPGRLVAWTVDRSTGEPAAGARVKIFDTGSRVLLSDRPVNSEGVAEAALQGIDEQGVVVMARQGEDVALSTGSGYALRTESPERLRGVVYTDRPVYRQSHVVKFRAIVREPAPEGYKLPETAVQAEITDPDGNVVTRKEGRLSAYGTFAGEWSVPADAPLGFYSLRVNAKDATNRWSGVYGTFNVEQYRKPDFEVRVTPAERRMIQGGQASFTIDARYFYGEPVPGGKVTYTVRSRRAWLPWMIEDDEDIRQDDADDTWSGEAESEKTGTLDADGRLTVTTPLRRAKFDLRYTVEAKVRDFSGRTFEGRGSILATVGSFFVTLEPETYVASPGSPSAVVVTARDYDGKPLPGVDVALGLSQYRWNAKSPESPAVWNSRVRTGENGKARVEVPIPGAGSWKLTAQAQSGPSTVSGETYLWAGGAGAQAEGDVIRIVPDKRRYAPGETARVLIIPAVSARRVWVSVEGRDLYTHRFVDASSGSAVFEFKVDERYTPNVELECIFISGNTIHRGMKRIKVPPAHKTLAVQLTPSKPQYKPGEPASYRLSARDHLGNPVKASFSLGVVDEAIYALYRDQLTDLIEPFYGNQWNRVETETSLEYYFSGEAGKRRVNLASAAQARLPRGQLKPERLVEPRIRKEFPDTAFWVADVETSSAGEATLGFTYPDSLTTWRATARGVTADTKLGQAVERAVVRKDLIVVPAVPRFLTEGDTVRTPMLVRNYTSDSKSAVVSVVGEGVSILEGAGGKVEAAPRGEGRLDAVLKPGPVAEAKLLVKALASGESDAVELKLPVVPAGLLRRSVTALTRPANSQQPVTASHTFPEAASAAWRQAVIRVTPSVAGALFEGLEYLLEYPYGCTEQTMSALLPNLAVAQAAEKLGLRGAVDSDALSKRVRAGIERLKSMQNDDGGWGWWRGGDSDPYLTAYVVWGLQLARSTNHFAAEPSYFRALGRLQKIYDEETEVQPDTRAFELYALALAKLATPPRIERAWALKPRMSALGQAFLGLALSEAGDARSASIARELAASVQREGSMASWQVETSWRWDFPSEGSTEATAMAAKLIAAEIPDSPLIPQAASWLMARRSRGYYWTNTKTTAFAILGLTGALARSGELSPDGTVTVFVDGKQVWSRGWGAADAMRRPESITVPLDSRATAHTVEIRKSGGSPLNASVEWLWREADALASSSGGLAVKRLYYRLVPAQSGEKIVYSLEPLAGPIRVGDTVAVSLKVDSARRHEYLIVEDRLPSGAEALDNFDGYTLRGRPTWWHGWFDRRETGDAQVRWYPASIGPAGAWYTYLMRFTNAGRFQVAPARVETMYDSSAQAWSDSLTLEVQP